MTVEILASPAIPRYLQLFRNACCHNMSCEQLYWLWLEDEIAEPLGALDAPLPGVLLWLLGSDCTNELGVLLLWGFDFIVIGCVFEAPQTSSLTNSGSCLALDLLVFVREFVGDDGSLWHFSSIRRFLPFENIDQPLKSVNTAKNTRRNLCILVCFSGANCVVGLYTCNCVMNGVEPVNSRFYYVCHVISIDHSSTNSRWIATGGCLLFSYINLCLRKIQLT